MSVSVGGKLRVSFDGPQQGWLTISFGFGEEIFRLSVEHVPFDVVTELANGLHDLLCGHPSAIARGTDGPIEYQLVFGQEGNAIKFEVVASYEMLAGKTRETLFVFSDALHRLVRPFWKALRDLETRLPMTEYEAQWREAFPMREMSLLTEKIRGKKHERS
jgi:hypothetical protein